MKSEALVELENKRREALELAGRLQEEANIIRRNVGRENNLRILAVRNELLPLIEHGRSSCSDDNTSNGWSGDRCRCKKCALIELDEYSDYTISISLDVEGI